MRIVTLLLFPLWLLSGVACAGPAKSYTYHEGDRPVPVYLDPDTIAEIDGAAVRLVPVQDAATRAALQRGALPAQMQGRYAPVFRSAPQGGRRMTLPGGVIVYLSPTWTQAQVQSWVAAQGLEVQQVVNPEKNGVLLRAAPGLPSLDLANRLRKSPEVKAAKPLWWQEVSKR